MTSSPFSRSFLVLGLGFAAGMQLGKVAPLIGRMQQDYGFSLTFLGWLVSLLGLFVALAAYPATRLVARKGATWSLKVGACIMIVGAVSLGFSPSSGPMIVARGIEASGYVILVIAAPAYLAAYAPSHLRSVLLALWGGFVPIGYALANFQVSALPADWPISLVLLTFTVPISVLSLFAYLALPTKVVAGTRASEWQRIPLAGWALAVAFGLYVYLSIGFFTFLPQYRASQGINGGAFAAIVGLCVPLGNFATAVLLRSFGATFAKSLALAGFGSTAIAASMLYSSSQLDAIFMPIYAFAGGLTASCLFAQVPRFAESERVAASIIGIMAQAGGIGTLLGPPFAGLLVETRGWIALGASLVGVALCGAVASLGVSRG
jgi:MFS transporter, CP family, cyanate transporter